MPISKSPYDIDFDDTLLAAAISQKSHDAARIDGYVDKFIKLVQADASLDSTEIVLWRGEVENRQVDDTFWVLAVSSDQDIKVTDKLFESVSGSWYDYSFVPVVDSGSFPFLLLAQKSLWLFDPVKGPDDQTDLDLGSKHRVSFLRFVSSDSSQSAEHSANAQHAVELSKLRAGVDEIVAKWQSSLTSSAIQNSLALQDDYIEFLMRHDGDINYATLRRLCEDVWRVPVHEIPMDGHGRTSVRHDWESSSTLTSSDDCSVEIAIKVDQSDELKLLSLAHEMSHYVFHFAAMFFFRELYSIIPDTPVYETAVAVCLDEGTLRKCFEIRELVADFCASHFVITDFVDKGIESLVARTMTEDRLSGDGHRLLFLERFFDPRMPAVGRRHVEQMSVDGRSVRSENFGKRYSPADRLRERTAYCVFNRQSEFKVALVRQLQMDQMFNQAFTLLELPAERLAMANLDPQAKLIERIRPSDLKECLASEREFWEPIIVEQNGESIPWKLASLHPDLSETSNGSANWIIWKPNSQSPSWPIEKWLEIVQTTALT